ncbi:MAG TPA: methyltransferase domain-containing protein [Euzebyales bacterium]|nr:methyltransferase domain-containing protein [Euzebyales bacterium]
MTHSSDVYTHGHHESVLRAHRWRTVENSAAYLSPYLAPGMNVLDVGCGPGSISADLARLVRPGRVLAVDNVAAIVEEAGAQIADDGTDNIEFAVADAYELDMPADSFDVVHAHQVLQHLSEPVVALGEMRRVCRPQGIVAVRDADYGAMTWYPADPALDRWLEVYHQVARSNQAEPDAGRRLHAWARGAGFTDVTASASVWCFASGSDRQWWGGLWADRVLASSFATQAIESGFATRGDLEEISAAWRRWADDQDGWFSVLHGEVLCRA